MKAGWVTTTLGELLEKTETTNPTNEPEVEFRYVDVSSVSNLTFSVEAVQLLKGKDAPSRARKMIRKNDVLFATIRPTLQRIAIVPEELDQQVCSTGYFVLRAKPEIDHRFLFYSLFTASFMGQMESLQKGASYPAVTDGEVKMQNLSYPPLPEQQRIVAILDEAFEAIAAARANAEQNRQNTRALFESYLQSVFSQRGEGWVDSGNVLSSMCELIVDCEHKTAPTQDEGFPSIRTPNIGKGKLLLDDVKRVSEETYRAWTRRAVPLPGDLIFAREAPAGNVAVVPDGLQPCLGQRTVLIRPKKEAFDSLFLTYLLLSPSMQEHLLSHSKGSTVQHINMKDIRALRLGGIPAIKEQRELARQITDCSMNCERIESLYQRKIEALDELKQSLLQQVFSGQL